MLDAPPQTHENQHADDDARAFMEVYKVTTCRRVPRNVSQPPAKRKLSEQQHRNQPMQCDGGPPIPRIVRCQLTQAGDVMRQVFNIGFA